MRRPDVLVVGGGAVGTAVAWALARSGARVELLERGALAGEASGAAAGMLAPIAEASDEDALFRAGVRSLALFPAHVAALKEAGGIDAEYEQSGVLRVATDSDAEAQLRGRAAALTGHDLAWLDGAALRALVPGVAAEIRGALHSPREGHVRSPLLVRAQARAARQCGAHIREGVPVLGLLRDGPRIRGVQSPEGVHEAGAVVLCSGTWAFQGGEWLGGERAWPLSPVRGQIVSLEPLAPAFRQILWGGETYLVPKRDGSLVVGATSETVGFDRRVTAAGVETLLRAAQRLVPGLGGARFLGAWAGLRPDTPDHLPLVGPVPGVEGLFLAAGHYRNGVLLAPLTAEWVRDGIDGKAFPEAAFLPERFLGRAGPHAPP